MPPDATPTALPEPGDEGVLYVLDLSGYVFRAYHAVPPLSTSRGEPTNAVHGFTNMMLKLVKDQRPVLMAVALDPRGPSFRKTLYDGYKANRPKAPPDLHQQMERCHEIVDAYQIPKLVVEGMEADDVIATVVRQAREAGLRVVIVASDKDLLQLVSDDVVMYDTTRDRVFGPLETEKKMGVPPAQVRDLLALAGDSSDNVPGVPSVGPKTAKTLLAAYGDLDGIYAHLDEITKKATKAKLAEYRDDAYLSRRLVTLNDQVGLVLDLDALRWTGGDPARLRELFVELEFTRLLKELDPGSTPEPARNFHVIGDAATLAEAAGSARMAGALALYTAIDGNAYLTGELVGLGLAWSDDSAAYVPFGHRTLGAPPQMKVEEALRVLGPLLEDATLPKRSADVKRDEVVLGRHGVRLRGGTFDSTIASYLLDAGKHAHDLEQVAREELGVDLLSYDRATDKQRGKQMALWEVEVERGRDFAAARAAAIWAIRAPFEERIEREGFLALMHDVELPLAHVLADMESTGIALDVDLLGKMSREVKIRLDQLEARCHELAGREFNVGSPRQLESILFDELGLPVIKRTKTARSTDQTVLEELAREHPLPETILEHRHLAKLKSTYLDALPREVDRETGRVHTIYNQAVAATGRLSSSEPNLQNIPIRTEIGRKIREAFVAREGWSMLSADYSQIELRVLAHLSGDTELVEAFRSGEDVHVRTATALFDVEPAQVTREQRGQAKTVNFAVIYGQSPFALARNLRIDRREAMRYIEAFFERYAGVASYMEALIEEARRTGGVRTLLGRRRMLPDLNSRNRALRQGAERVARNTPIQGSAADIMKVAMVAIHRGMEEQGMESRMLLTVHDELVLEAPPAEKAVIETLVRSRMESALELSVPLLVEHGWGRSWGEAH